MHKRGSPMTHTPKPFTLKFVRKEKASELDAYSFFFGKKDFDYIPGNYLRLILDKDFEDKRGKWRYFSISSAPSEDFIMITTRIIWSPFKKELLNLVEGEDVKVFAPLGKFLFYEEDATPRVFIAGGIGVTPFRPMLVQARKRNLTIPLTLFASFSTVEEIVYRSELETMNNSSSSIKTVITVTHPEESKKEWHGETGRLNKDMIQKYIPDISKPIYMIAGPEGLVDALSQTIKDMGVTEEKIITEHFPGY